MKSHSLILALLTGTALQFGCGGNHESAQEPAAHPVSVQALMLQPAAVPVILEAPGTVQSRNRAALAAQINGFVRDMRVRTGDSVAAGQLLALLDARDPESQKAAAQSAVDEAQAGLAEARRGHQAAIEMRAAAKASADLAAQTLARYEKLLASRSVSPQEIDEVRMRRSAAAAELASRESMVAAAEERIKQVESRVAQAKAQAQRADVLLSWTQIKAPSAGKIVERLADPGAAIFPGSPLFILESSGNAQVLASIPAESAGVLHAGMPVQIRIDSQREPLAGRVTEIAPASDPSSHSHQFKADLPPGARVPTGQFAAVLIPYATRQALLVPVTAVRATGQLTGVFVIDDASQARYRLIKMAPFDSNRVEILSGLEPGERIIVNADNRIMDGATVAARP